MSVQVAAQCRYVPVNFDVKVLHVMIDSHTFTSSMRHVEYNAHIWLPIASEAPTTRMERIFSPESRLPENGFQVGKRGQEKKNIGDFYQALALLEDMELGLLPGDEKARWRDPTSGSLVTRKLWRRFEKSCLVIPKPLSITVRSVDLPEKESTELELLSRLQGNSLSPTERENLAKSRIGQGLFREGVSKVFRGKCAVTQSSALLTASHIKPWRDSSNKERLDPYNGLLLSPVYDKAFDAGLISFTEEGHILISELFVEDAKKLSIDSSVRIELQPQHLPYIEVHMKEYFRGTKL